MNSVAEISEVHRNWF